MSERATVVLRADGPIRVVTLNRPEALNAANIELHQAFAAVWPTIAADPSARAVILTGAGRAFSAGGDRRLLAGDAEAVRLLELAATANAAQTRGILTLALPVIAAVNGPAVGWGAALVAMCDLVVMADDAYLSEPHGAYGIAPSSALEVLWPRQTSMVVAKDLLMTGRRVGAAEALRLGLANRVVPSAELMDACTALATELLDVPAAGVALAKAAVNRPVLAALGLDDGATLR